MHTSLRLTLAIVGALVYATAGGIIGAENAGWIGSGREANDLLPWLGVGAGLVVVAYVGTWFSQEVARAGALGNASKFLLVVGCVLFIAGAVIQFAIFGTLSLAAGLFCLAAAAIREKLATVADRVLITVSAIGSITWNTETSSALLLIGVGLIWIALSIRLLPRSENELRDS